MKKINLVIIVFLSFFACQKELDSNSKSADKQEQTALQSKLTNSFVVKDGIACFNS